MKRIYSIIILCFLVFTSCMTTKTPVGSYREAPGTEYTYAKGKQMWLLYGIFPIGRTAVKTPADGNCEVVTKFTFVDFLISGLTGGILTTETIKVNAKHK